MRPAQGALRVGLLYDLLGRVSNRDTRDVSIEALINASRLDREQAARVASLTESIYRTLRPEASAEDMRYIRWSALVHEAGMIISSSRYHRHSHYIVSNADMPGFSRKDQDTMAALVLSQRGSLRKLDGLMPELVSREAVLSLRLAVIFGHARHDVTLPVMDVSRTEDGGLRLRFDEVWLNAHPLTAYLLRVEGEDWAKIGEHVLVEKF